MSSNNDIVLKVENLSKIYRLGEIGTGTISHDLNRWWARVRGKEDPFAKVGTTNDRTQIATKGEYVKVLDDINFEVKEGEVLGIIGKNGAGKSTLLKVISQITSPSSGSIKSKGRIASLLEVGTGMHPEMTGKENVYLNGTILGMTKREIDVKYDEIMDFAGCAKYADTPVKRYSSGMKVRLGFAVAAFLEPEILIVDEVLAVGDAEFQKKAIGKMQDISSGGGRTVLFVSHNMASVESLCSRCILLKDGKKVADDITNLVVDSYLMDKVDLLQSAPLINRSDRKGNGKAKFQNFKITTENLKEVIRMKSGGSYILNVTLINSGLDDVKNINIGIGIDNDRGYRVGFISNLNSGQSEICSLEMDKINTKIQINEMPYASGTYSLTLFAEQNGEILDWIQDATLVEVEDGDFYGTGKILPSGQGDFLLKYKYLNP